MQRLFKIFMIGVGAVAVLLLGAAFWGMSEIDRYEKMTPKERAAEQVVDKARKQEKVRRNLVEHADGKHCLGTFDGQHSVFVDYYSEQLREPDSFEHIRTLIYPVDENGQHELLMTYRARNGFSGMNVETVRAKIANSDCSFRLIAS